MIIMVQYLCSFMSKIIVKGGHSPHVMSFHCAGVYSLLFQNLLHPPLVFNRHQYVFVHVQPTQCPACTAVSLHEGGLPAEGGVG